MISTFMLTMLCWLRYVKSNFKNNYFSEYKSSVREFMAVQWLAVGTFTVVAWIQSDWETKIPKATQHGQKKKGSVNLEYYQITF